jgi:hypothetical protein
MCARVCGGEPDLIRPSAYRKGREREGKEGKGKEARREGARRKRKLGKAREAGGSREDSRMLGEGERREDEAGFRTGECLVRASKRGKENEGQGGRELSEWLKARFCTGEYTGECTGKYLGEYMGKCPGRLSGERKEDKGEWEW